MSGRGRLCGFPCPITTPENKKKQKNKKNFLPSDKKNNIFTKKSLFFVIFEFFFIELGMLHFLFFFWWGIFVITKIQCFVQLWDLKHFTSESEHNFQQKRQKITIFRQIRRF